MAEEGYVDPIEFDKVSNKLRDFFKSKGFIECHEQSRFSILAACENPSSIVSYNYLDQVFPLIQTNQLQMDKDLLKTPSLKGLYCITTSYRNEKISDERRKRSFPMFEFEALGDTNDILQIEREVLDHLGYKRVNGTYPEAKYLDLAKKYNVKDLDDEHEELVCKEHGPVFFIKNFPNRESFWNMKALDNDCSEKIDIILNNYETFGTSSRETDPKLMRKRFMEQTNGEYSQLLFDKFGKERVMKELDEYLALPFVPRYGGGIGLTRLIRSMKLEGLI